MAVAYIIYALILLISTLLIARKNVRSIVYLPVIFILYEVLKNVFIEFGIESGINGFQNLNISLFIIPHLKRVIRRASLLFLIIYFFFIYYLFRTPFTEDIVSLVVQTLGLFNIYTLILVGFTLNVNKYEDVFNNLNKSYLYLLMIYCLYVIVASLLQFGPNHYNTGIIYGLRYEQYYSAALVIILFPIMHENLSKNEEKKYKLFSVIGIIIIILTLRRAALAILIFGFVLFPLFTDLKTFLRWSKRYAFLIVSIFLLAGILYVYTDLYSSRDLEFSTEYDIEEEGRFIELNLVSYTLNKENSYVFGIGKFLNEEGNYNFFNNERALHGTIAKLLLGGGGFGLILYLMIFLYIVMKIKKYSINASHSKYRAMGLTLVFLYLIVSLTGAIGVGTGVSFTGSLFLYLGFLVNILKSSYYASLNNADYENRLEASKH